MRLAAILGSLSEREAFHVYNALAQWADNERNGLEETEPSAETAKHNAAVACVESIVRLLEAEIARSV